MKRVFSLTLSKHPYSIPQIQQQVFTISFWLSPFTCMSLLNISFSPADYIFLEITSHPGHRYTGSSDKKGASYEPVTIVVAWYTGSQARRTYSHLLHT